MDDTNSDTGLLLPDLSIENFRGIRKLSIPRWAASPFSPAAMASAKRLYWMPSESTPRVDGTKYWPMSWIFATKSPLPKTQAKMDRFKSTGRLCSMDGVFPSKHLCLSGHEKRQTSSVSRQLSLIMSILHFHICRVNSCNAFQETVFEHSRLNARGTAISSFRLAMVGVYRALKSCSQRLSTNLWGRGSWRDPIWPAYGTKWR